VPRRRNVASLCLRRERQLEGIAKAKAAGVYKGRPPSIEASRVRELKAQGMKGPRQVERLKAAGCTKVFSEKVSGKSTNGRHDKAIRALQPGDSTGWRGQFAIC
jgi:DNA invertase Pin-like site-specific DNA recombinase